MSDRPRWLSLVHRFLTGSSRLFAGQQRLFARGYRDLCAVFRPMLPAPGARVLDVGCGTAHCAEALLAGGDYAYTGMDANEAYVESNRRRRPDWSFRRAERLDERLFADHCFDCALVFSLLHHLDDAASRDLVSELRRVLVPGGAILVSEPLFWDGPVSGIRRRLSNRLLGWDRGRHIRSAAGYRALFSGFAPGYAPEYETEYVYTWHRFWAARFRT